MAQFWPPDLAAQMLGLAGHLKMQAQFLPMQAMPTMPPNVRMPPVQQPEREPTPAPQAAPQAAQQPDAQPRLGDAQVQIEQLQKQLQQVQQQQQLLLQRHMPEAVSPSQPSAAPRLVTRQEAPVPLRDAQPEPAESSSRPDAGVIEQLQKQLEQLQQQQLMTQRQMQGLQPMGLQGLSLTASGVASPTPSSQPCGTATPQAPPVFHVDDPVEAQCEGWGDAWFPGKVRELRSGEIQVLWEGDEPSISNVPVNMVRHRKGAQAPSDSKKRRLDAEVPELPDRGEQDALLEFQLRPGADCSEAFATLRRRLEVELKEGKRMSIQLTVTRPAPAPAPAPAPEASPEAEARSGGFPPAPAWQSEAWWPSKGWGKGKGKSGFAA